MVETWSLDVDTQEKPEKYGFTDVDTSCYKGNLEGQVYDSPALCSNPAGAKYWEHVHFSSKFHCFLAYQAMLDLVNQKEI